MNQAENFVRALAGTMVLAGLLGGHLINELLYLVTAFVGLNLVQSSFTDVCPAETFYRGFILD